MVRVGYVDEPGVAGARLGEGVACGEGAGTAEQAVGVGIVDVAPRVVDSTLVEQLLDDSPDVVKRHGTHLRAQSKCMHQELMYASANV